MKILINKKLTEAKNAKISIDQRACLFGDGIFETCLISNGAIYNFNAHKNRIKAGLKALKFSAKIDDLENESYKLIKKNQVKNGILRISISRGIGSVGYLPTYKTKPLIIIQTLPQRKIKTKKIILGIGSRKKPPQNSLPINCKTMQSLPYTLNKIEAAENKWFDAIMLSQKNFISETSSANIFWVKNGVIYTSSKDCDIVFGTIREKIIKNFKVKEVKAKIADLQKADEVFLTNVSYLALPVGQISTNKKITNFKKEVSLEILKWLKNDIRMIN
ncbi:MAG: aminotransferase class IV [Rickettsiales bacterium]|nr:aminotransferase class IV [Rickettsiales bacterium]